MHRTILKLIIVGVFLLSGCATVTRGPNVKLHVVTDPPGAKVETNLMRRNFKEGDSTFYECEPTPCYIHVSRRSEFTMNITKEGYHPASVEITSGFGGGGGVVGATGAVLVAGSVYSVVYSLASFGPALFGMANTGAATAAIQGATVFGALTIGVDVASGALLSVRPNPVVLVLIPSDQPVPEDTFVESEEEFRDLMDQLGRETPGDALEPEAGKAE